MEKRKRLLKLFSVAGIGFFFGLSFLIPDRNNSMQVLNVPYRYVQDTLRGFTDTLYFPGPDSTDAYPIQNYQFFSFGVEYDTGGTANTVSKEPKLLVQWLLTAYNGTQIIEEGKTTPWTTEEDSVLYMDFSNLYTLNPSPSWKITFRVLFDDDSNTVADNPAIDSSRAIPVRGEFQSIK